MRGYVSLTTILGQRATEVEGTLLQAMIRYIFISIYYYYIKDHIINI